MGFNPRRGSLQGARVERAKCGQAETDEFDDGGGPRVTGDGPAAQQVPFKSLS